MPVYWSSDWSRFGIPVRWRRGARLPRRVTSRSEVRTVTSKLGPLSVVATVLSCSLWATFTAAPASVAAPSEHSIPQVPDTEWRLAGDAVEQFIVEGRPRVLSSSRVFDYPPGSPILVCQESSGNASLPTSIPAGQEDAFRDYRRRNATSAEWSRPFKTRPPCAFAPPLRGSLCDYYNGIQRTLPQAGGVLKVSRPGFSADGQTAWISIHIDTGPGTAPRLSWWVKLHRQAARWVMEEACTFTEYDEFLARLPATLPRQGASLEPIRRKVR